jgi:4-hydroxymandelate oxidase
MILSPLSNTPIEAVAAAAPGSVWFQLYVYRDRGATADLVARAAAAGCRAIVLTVDAPILGRRPRDVRNRFRLPDGLTVSNLEAAGHGSLREINGSALAAYVHELFDPGLTFADLGWLCGLTDLPVLVKGVVRGDDAAAALDHGAAGVIVSNHGGRQLDAAPPTIDALPDVVTAVAGRAPVLVDGGIRRGVDVVRALALGAAAVAIGRPVLWGLAVGGEAGVADVLRILRVELDEALALCGCASVGDVGRDMAQAPGAAQRG